MPRTTLQAWQSWYETLDICPQVAEFFQSGSGLAFLHRLVLALHLVWVEVGACGMRLVCLLLRLTGLHRFVAASYGAPQQVNRQVEHAIVEYRQAETPRLAKDMPRQSITVTQDETFTGGLCLVASEPSSNFTTLAQLAQALTPFSSRVLTGRRLRNDFSVKSPGRCWPRFWTRSNCHPRLEVRSRYPNGCSPLKTSRLYRI